MIQDRMPTSANPRPDPSLRREAVHADIAFPIAAHRGSRCWCHRQHLRLPVSPHWTTRCHGHRAPRLCPAATAATRQWHRRHQRRTSECARGRHAGRADPLRPRYRHAARAPSRCCPAGAAAKRRQVRPVHVQQLRSEATAGCGWCRALLIRHAVCASHGRQGRQAQSHDRRRRPEDQDEPAKLGGRLRRRGPAGRGRAGHVPLAALPRPVVRRVRKRVGRGCAARRWCLVG